MFRKCLYLLLILGVSGCSSLDTRSPGERVLSRSQERLDALMARDIDKAYSYASPGYRSSHTTFQYDKKFGGAKTLWTAARAVEADCDELLTPVERCRVLIEIDYTTRYLGYLETSEMYETWILSDSEWYLYLQ